MGIARSKNKSLHRQKVFIERLIHLFLNSFFNFEVCCCLDLFEHLVLFL